MAITPIPRLPSTAIADIRARVQRSQPVVVQRPFAGSPVEDCTDPIGAVSRLGTMPLMTQWSYAATLGLTSPTADGDRGFRQYTLAEYLELIRRDPATPRMCMEQPLPAELRELVDVPSYCRGEGDANDVEWLLFVGNRGNSALLHFDADHRYVLLYQVFGEKRIVLIEPRQFAELECWGNVSMLPFAQWDEATQRSFLERVGAHVATLTPGEAVLIPALWWHGVDYVDTGMSLSVRFGRNDRGRWAHAELYPDTRVQNLGLLFLGAEQPAGEQRDAFAEIQRTCAVRHETPAERERAIDRCLSAACETLLPELRIDEVLGARPDLRERERVAAQRFYHGRMQRGSI